MTTKFTYNHLLICTAALVGLTGAWAQPNKNLAAHENCPVDCSAACCAEGHGGHIHDDPAPISLMGTHAHPKGEWMLSYRYMRMDMDGMRDGSRRISSAEIFNQGYTVTPEDMTMDMHMLGLMYAPTDDFTLMLMGNYIDSSMDHRIFSQMAANMINGGATTFTTEAEGLGDTTLTALYGLHPGNGIEVIAGLGLSLPTGSITESDTLPGMGGPMDRRLPAAMQLGSGTYDLLPSLTWIHDLAPWAYGVQARGVIRMEDENSEGYRRGHVFALTSWASYKLPHGFTLSAGAEYERTGELKGTQSDVSQMGPNGRSVTTAFGENYGGERIDGILGLHYQGTTGWLTGHRIGLDLRLPIHQDLNRLQLETDSVVTLGWQKVF